VVSPYPVFGTQLRSLPVSSYYLLVSEPETITYTLDDHGTLREVIIDADMRGLLDGATPCIYDGVVFLRAGVALHREVYAKRHVLDVRSIPPLIRLNGEKLDCRSSNLAPRPPKKVLSNQLLVPVDELRWWLGDDFGVRGPLLLPSKYVPEARRVGVLIPGDQYPRTCRACGCSIHHEDSLEIFIERGKGGTLKKCRVHPHECIAPGEEVSGTLSWAECWIRVHEWQELHPELQEEANHSKSEYEDEMYSDDYEDDGAPDERDDPYEQGNSNSRPGIATEIIVHVSTAESKVCPICKEVPIGAGQFEHSCNHLISEHGLTCLHVGSETHFETSVSPAIATVAVFGK
jgi:hypothetical protein